MNIGDYVTSVKTCQYDLPLSKKTFVCVLNYDNLQFKIFCGVFNPTIDYFIAVKQLKKGNLHKSINYLTKNDLLNEKVIQPIEQFKNIDQTQLESEDYKSWKCIRHKNRMIVNGCIKHISSWRMFMGVFTPEDYMEAILLIQNGRYLDAIEFLKTHELEEPIPFGSSRFWHTQLFQ